MAHRTQDILLRLAAGRDSLPLGLSLHQILTLASIVEAEAMADVERPRIAAVYLNRLQMGMRLQADPTVGYAIGRGPRTRLLLKHLRVDSPFNTYLYEGLPPGPICNPGRASIASVIDPLPGLKELYFVADGNGRHLFSNTYEEHLAKIRMVRGREEQSPDSAPARPAPTSTAVAVPTPAAIAESTAVHPPAKPGAKVPPAATKKAGTSVATKPDTTSALKHSAPTSKKPAAATASRSESTSATRHASTSAAKKPASAAASKPDTAKKSASAAKPDTTKKTAAAKKPAKKTTPAAAPVTKPVAGTP